MPTPHQSEDGQCRKATQVNKPLTPQNQGGNHNKPLHVSVYQWLFSKNTHETPVDLLHTCILCSFIAFISTTVLQFDAVPDLLVWCSNKLGA